MVVNPISCVILLLLHFFIKLFFYLHFHCFVKMHCLEEFRSSLGIFYSLLGSLLFFIQLYKSSMKLRLLMRTHLQMVLCLHHLSAGTFQPKRAHACHQHLGVGGSRRWIEKSTVGRMVRLGKIWIFENGWTSSGIKINWRCVSLLLKFSWRLIRLFGSYVILWDFLQGRLLGDLLSLLLSLICWRTWLG